jgi:hypothetical protein
LEMRLALLPGRRPLQWALRENPFRVPREVGPPEVDRRTPRGRRRYALANDTKVLRLPYQGGVATIVTSIVAQPDDLVIDAGDEPGKAKQTTTSPRDRAWWESTASAPFMATVDEIARSCVQHIGPSRVDHSAQSYVSLKKGRRAWLPMWPRANGAYVYLPGGPNGSADAPSDFFSQVQVKLEAIGLESPTWTYKYNGRANPVGFAIPREKATHSVVREILTVAYELA